MKKGIKNLLLLSCKSSFLDNSKIYAPMANLYLKSYLNHHLPDVNVVLGDDDYDLNKPEMFEPYDAIGISIMTPQKKEASKILQTIKKYYPDKTVIAGGPHIRHYLGEILKNDEPYDYFVPLDGEKVLTGILKGDVSEFSNTYIRTGLKDSKRIVVETYEDPRILVHEMSNEDIHKQPRPDRTSLDAKNVIDKYSYSLGGKRATTMMTARGCPGQCAFCENAMTSIRWSSLESIQQQLDDIKNLGYEGVYIFDDLFTISMDKFKQIAEELKKRDIIYRCNVQANYFTQNGEEFAKLLTDTGCYEIGFGAESGSQRILDGINKKTTVEMNYKTVEYAKKHNLKVKAFIVLGLPGENWATLKETEKFIATSGLDDFAPYVYMPYKGTQLRDALDRNEDIGLRMLVPEVSGAYGIKGGETAYEIETSDLSAEDLKAFRNYLMVKYSTNLDKESWKRKFYDTQIITGESYSKLVHLSRTRILIRVEEHVNLGMGNIYRSIRIAQKLKDLYSVKLKFVMGTTSIIGMKKILDSGFEVDIVNFSNVDQYTGYIKNFNPNIIINDILNLEEGYMKEIKKFNSLIVNFEDGKTSFASKYADIVFNTLYENKESNAKYYCGLKYAPLPHTFKDLKVRKIEETCKNFLLTFGGSDSSGFTLKVAKSLNKIPNIKTTVYLGSSFSQHEKLYDLLKNLDRDNFIIRYDFEYNPKDFEDVDIAIASGTNTCYELAAAGVPTILLCQNEVEVERGNLISEYRTVLNLGDGNKLSDEDLLNNIKSLMSNFELRKEMSRNGKSLVDGYGVERIVEVIFNELKEKNG